MVNTDYWHSFQVVLKIIPISANLATVQNVSYLLHSVHNLSKKQKTQNNNNTKEENIWFDTRSIQLRFPTILSYPCFLCNLYASQAIVFRIKQSTDGSDEPIRLKMRLSAALFAI